MWRCWRASWGTMTGLAGTSDRASSYEVAAATDTPVVLVVPGRGMSKSLVPLIKGFVQYRPDSHIAGVILNRISKGMYPLLKQMVEEELAEANGGKGIRVLGYVPELTDPFLTGRHLGLVLPEEIPEVQTQMEKLGALLAETLDLPGLAGAAQTAAGGGGISGGEANGGDISGKDSSGRNTSTKGRSRATEKRNVGQGGSACPYWCGPG